MKQYVLKASSDPTVAGCQARKAIDSGFRWLQVELPDNLNEDEVRKITDTIAQVCRERSCDTGACNDASRESSDFEIIMTLVDKVAITDELKITGVHLSSSNPQIVRAAREQLGAHAIIGVDCSTPDEALALKTLDIDYITVPVTAEQCVLDRFTKIIEVVNGNGHRLHIVAKGDFTPEEETILLGAGAAGFAIDEK